MKTAELNCHPPGECSNDIAAEVACRDKRHLRLQRRSELRAFRGIAFALLISAAMWGVVFVVSLAIDGALHHWHMWGR